MYLYEKSTFLEAFQTLAFYQPGFTLMRLKQTICSVFSGSVDSILPLNKHPKGAETTVDFSGEMPAQMFYK